MTTASSTDQLLEAWRTARREAEDAHRRAMADADKLYQAWLTAQQDAAVRSAALTTATWEDRLGAMKVLGDVTLHMRKPGDSPDLCHNGHLFEPGIDADRPHEPGDPRWCDVCGEARKPGRSPSVTVAYTSTCACGWTTRRYATHGNWLALAKIRHDLSRHPLIALRLRKPKTAPARVQIPGGTP
jgi:hypothetical protein